jgi:hypothetical protein
MAWSTGVCAVTPFVPPASLVQLANAHGVLCDAVSEALADLWQATLCG